MPTKIEIKKPDPKKKINLFIPVEIAAGAKKVANDENIPISSLWCQVMKSFLVDRKVISNKQ